MAIIQQVLAFTGFIKMIFSEEQFVHRCSLSPVPIGIIDIKNL
jgi:hypothetical protein